MSRKLRAQVYPRQHLHLTVSQQVLANTCQPAPVRHSSKLQLRFRQQVSQKFQYRQVKVVPRLLQLARASLQQRVSPLVSSH